MKQLEKIQKELDFTINWYETFKSRKPKHIPLKRADYELLRKSVDEFQRKAYPNFVLYKEVKVVSLN